MQEINYFDVVILSVVLLLGLKGLLSGLVKELFGLLGIIGGVYTASRYANDAGLFIDQNIIHLQNHSALALFGFLVLFIGIWLGAYFLGILVANLTKASGLGFFDRFFGFIFGAGKIFIIFAVIVYALSNVEFVKKMTLKYTQNSLVYPYLMDAGSVVVKIDPKDINPIKSNATPQLPAVEMPKIGIEQNGTLQAK